MMAESLMLKWGTLKGWDLKTDKSKEAARKYVESGISASAMAQHDTKDQKELLCNLIDVVDGEIVNDWSGDVMTKEEAKKYVREYGI
jgi:hypothetical protein